MISTAYIPPIRRIQLEVCEEYGITLQAMLSRRRRPKLVEARREAMTLARLTKASYSEIGRAFGRHHTTVMSACNALARRKN
jgi:chromosomal replication initiation ATPase DnaA